MNIEKKVFQFIDQYTLIEEGDRVLLSLSAGKDSMALVHLLLLYKNKCDFTIGIFHLNHKTRGEDSNEDERHVVQLAKHYNIPLYAHSYNFTKLHKEKGSFEDRARTIRYELLHKISHVHAYNKIAVAHNKDDSIETVLLRLFNGTGLWGMRGIDVKYKNIIRPLLCVSKDEIYSYLNKKKILWREDRSNKENIAQRNFLRNEIIPQIINQFPNFNNSLENFQKHAYDTSILLNDLIQNQYGTLYEIKEEEVILKSYKYDTNIEVFKIILLKSARESFGVLLTIPILKEIVKKYFSIKNTVVLYTQNAIEIKKIQLQRKSHISITAQATKTLGRETKEWHYTLAAGDLPRDMYIAEIDIYITMRIISQNEFKAIFNKKDTDKVYITMPEKVSLLSIRNRKNGDHINLTAGRKKIKAIFIEKKLDNDIKNCVPLLIIDSQIAAVMPGLKFNLSNRVAKDFMVHNNSKYILEVSNRSNT